jgi:hypothetical protein
MDCGLRLVAFFARFAFDSDYFVFCLIDYRRRTSNTILFSRSTDFDADFSKSAVSAEQRERRTDQLVNPAQASSCLGFGF